MAAGLGHGAADLAARGGRSVPSRPTTRELPPLLLKRLRFGSEPVNVRGRACAALGPAGSASRFLGPRRSWGPTSTAGCRLHATTGTLNEVF